MTKIIDIITFNDGVKFLTESKIQHSIDNLAITVKIGKSVEIFTNVDEFSGFIKGLKLAKKEGMKINEQEK